MKYLWFWRSAPVVQFPNPQWNDRSLPQGFVWNSGVWVKLATSPSLPFSLIWGNRHVDSALLPAWESRGMMQDMPRGCLLHVLAGAGAVGKPSACFCRCLIQTFTFLCRHHLVLSVCSSFSAVASWERREWSQTTQSGVPWMLQAHSPREDPKQGGLGYSASLGTKGMQRQQDSTLSKGQVVLWTVSYLRIAFWGALSLFQCLPRMNWITSDVPFCRWVRRWQKDPHVPSAKCTSSYTLEFPGPKPVFIFCLLSTRRGNLKV